MAPLALQADRMCPKSIERKWIVYSLSTLTGYVRTVSLIVCIDISSLSHPRFTCSGRNRFKRRTDSSDPDGEENATARRIA